MSTVCLAKTALIRGDSQRESLKCAEGAEETLPPLLLEGLRVLQECVFRAGIRGGDGLVGF